MASLSPSSGKRPRVDDGAGAGASPPPVPAAVHVNVAALRPRLVALSQGQLADVLLGVMATGALTEEDLLAALPPPDLSEVKERLAAANHLIRRAMPNSRWGSSADEYSYRRCAAAVTAFKKLLAAETKAIEAAGHPRSVFLFCEVSADAICATVTWENESHNKWQAAAEKTRDRLALKTAKAMAKDATVDTDELQFILDSFGETYPAIVKPLETAIAKR
ncbi:hypothetical protein BU14_0207s0001 [Porphyra umbilicalis]|uniref:Uncharacterized protein n=1 Tax=Porphyra umbilicalis TaxID=2786 RepID=A0A1X6P5D1_PORUM|nr:hypothetical protein BU14_0207s0001 [Porphyra umbilicalis]|eukprot:OSX76082.1 hypothetical protein BU14_0207s0001 [Porphyra umbilicalis]